jgi:hypothetical protein
VSLFAPLADESDASYVEDETSGGAPSAITRPWQLGHSLNADGSGGTATTTQFFVALNAAGMQVGDLMILEFTHRGSGNGTVTDNSGDGVSWTRKGGALFSASTFSVQVYYKRVTSQIAAGGTAVTVSGLTNSSCGGISAFRGAIASGDPFEAFVAEANKAAGAETHAGVTTVTPNAWVGMANGTSPDTTITYTAPLVERHDRVSTGGTDTSYGNASYEKAATGATGTLTFNWAVNQVSAAIAYAITPASGTPSSTGVMRLSLSSGSTPPADTGHKIKLRAAKMSGSADAVLKAAIYEGATNRSTDLATGNLTGSLADYVLTLSEADAANITDYSNLELRVWAESAAGENSMVIRVSRAGFETPVTSGTAHNPGTIPDTLSLADNVTVVIGRGVAVPDTLALADQTATASAYQRVVNDLAGLADGQALAVGRALTVPDTLGLADQANAGLLRLVDVPDTLALADQATPAVAWAEDIADPVALADATTTAGTYTRQVPDALGLADQATTVQGHVWQAPDTLALADSLARVVTYARLVADPVALADDVAIEGAGAQSRTVDDTLALADALATVAQFARNVADPVGLADQVTTTAALLRDVADPFVLADTVTPSHGYGRLVADPLAFADATQALIIIDRQIGDTLTLADATSLAIGRGILVNDPLALADALARQAAYVHAIADPVALADQATPAVAFAVTVTDPVALADSTVALILLLRNVADTLTLADQATLNIGRGTVIDDTLTVTDSGLVIAHSMVAAIADTLTLADMLDRVAAYDRVLADTLLLGDLILAQRRSSAVELPGYHEPPGAGGGWHGSYAGRWGGRAGYWSR